jgi:hypothetical protein
MSARSINRVGANVQDKRAWRVRQELPTNAHLDVMPFPISSLDDDSVPPDPLSTDDRLDPFTAECWRHIEETCKPTNVKTAYRADGLMTDSIYTHIVKELHQPGHLHRCGLQQHNARKFNAIYNRIYRNERFMLFTSATKPNDAGFVMGMPILYAVKRNCMELMAPALEDCCRIVPISQVRSPDAHLVYRSAALHQCVQSELDAHT